jgi:hypothetical protein
MAFADEQVAGLEYDGGSAISVARNAVSEGEDWKYSSVPSLLTPTQLSPSCRRRPPPGIGAFEVALKSLS